MDKKEIIDSYWHCFLKETSRDKDLKYFECFHFDLTEKWANELLRLVLEGKKRATSSSLLYYQKNDIPLPKAGDCSIVTDWEGNPKCVIQTTNVTILPFKDITFDICKREGEDENLQSWQEGHVDFFTADGNSEGYDFTWDMPVVFEDFEVIFK